MPNNLAQHMVKHEQVVAENSQLRARIAELEEQYANANAANLTFGKQAARIAELEAALKPFAVAYSLYKQSDWPSKADLLELLIASCITVDYLRAARAALEMKND